MLAAGVFVDELLLSELVDVLDTDLSLVAAALDDFSPDDFSPDDFSPDDLSLDESLEESLFVDLLLAPGPRLSVL